MVFMLFLLAVAGAGFGYLVYTKGYDGAVAAVAALAAAAAAYASGAFEYISNLF